MWRVDMTNKETYDRIIINLNIDDEGPGSTVLFEFFVKIVALEICCVPPIPACTASSMPVFTALRTASLLSADLPNIRQKPLAADATRSFPGFRIGHCIFSFTISEFENTTN